MNKKIKKTLKNIVLFIFLIWLTFHILLKDQNMDELFYILGDVKIQYVLLGILCMIGYFSCESINLRRTLNSLGEKVKFRSAMKYSLIGFFYSSITPAATGGQPMQVYYMHKDNIKAASSTLALVINLWSFQTITLSMALISVIFLHAFLDAGLVVLFIIGITLNSTAWLLLTIGLFSRRLSAALVRFTIKVMKKFKMKKVDEYKAKLEGQLQSYQDSAKYMRSNRKFIVKTFFTTFIQEVVYYSVPFFVYYAFGFSGENYVKMVALQSIVYATVSGIPSPGAVGVSEGAFVSIFEPIFTEKLIKGAVLLNRGISFYLFVLICAIIVIYNTLKDGKSQKNQLEQLENEKIEIEQSSIKETNKEN